MQVKFVTEGIVLPDPCPVGVDVEGATALWRRCLRRPSRALPALEALVWAVASELGPIQVGPITTGARGIRVQLDWTLHSSNLGR